VQLITNSQVPGPSGLVGSTVSTNLIANTHTHTHTHTQEDKIKDKTITTVCVCNSST